MHIESAAFLGYEFAEFEELIRHNNLKATIEIYDGIVVTGEDGTRVVTFDILGNYLTARHFRRVSELVTAEIERRGK